MVLSDWMNELIKVKEEDTKRLNERRNEQIVKGDEAARFNLGSTVVLLFKEGVFNPLPLEKNIKLKFGQEIGSLR